MSRKSIYLLNTGGTIGMKPSSQGYRLAPGWLRGQLAQISELADEALPEIHLEEYDPLLDSANMVPADWVLIANDIASNYERYDAFVILHGTDTMAYTASALSFMLEELAKTVILTGSQIPLSVLRSDARDNLVTSLLLAVGDPIPEVSIFFDHKLLRGNRARKINADRLDAFESPNFPPLAITGVDFVVHRDRILPAGAGKLQVHEISQPFVGHMRIFPGISADILQNFLQPPLQGLVIETYGVGNAPDRDREFADLLRAATERGVVVVSCTQSIHGSVDLEDYATGKSLKRAGVISGFDMTPEAALTKLFYLFSRGLPPEDVRREMQRNLRGELTLPDA